jgi:hypothetical protein
MNNASACAAIAVFFMSVAQVPPLAQANAPTSHPSFAGTWAPSVPADSDRRYDVGLTRIPGQGRLTIEQSANRLTVTMTIPDNKLEPLLAVQGRLYPTAIYYLSEVRTGGYGAGGAPQPTQPTWLDNRLVIPNPWPGLTHPTTQMYSLDGNHLTIETRVDMGAGRVNDITERFDKVK